MAAPIEVGNSSCVVCARVGARYCRPEVHRERHAVAEAVYLAEVDPVSRADVVIDHHDWAAPRVLR